MENKLHIGRIILYGQPELSEADTKIVEEFAIHFKKLKAQIIFFRQGIKEALINKFSQIVNFSKLFSDNFDLLKQDISSLIQDSSSQLYRTPLAEYRQVVQSYKESQIVANEKELVAILQKTKEILETLYQSFSGIQKKLSKVSEQKVLNDLKRQLMPIESKLAEIDREILASSLHDDAKLLTLAKSASSNKFGITWREMSPRSILLDKYNKLLENLKNYAKLENIFIFNFLLETWIEKTNNLISALKKIDDFWLNINNNLQELEEFIIDNEKSEAIVEKILNYLTIANNILSLHSNIAKKFEYKSTVKVPFAMSENKYLDLVFLFKETSVYR